MRTGKIARLPNDIREQLNCRLKNGVQGKSILKWVNSLPEVKAIFDADFDGHPVSPSNLTEWKDGGYRDWLVRQDALAMVTDLQDENALGDKALTSAFNDKLARWVSIHYAATAQALLASQLDPDTKWSRLRQLCADVSRLRRGDLHAERLNLDREWLALEQSKTDQQREKDFQAWLQRPDVQEKHFPKQKGGISREALALVDNYLMDGISPLDPEEAKKLYPFGRFATQPPIGFELEHPAPSDDCTRPGDETLTAASPTDPAIHESTDPSIPAPLQNSNTPSLPASSRAPSSPASIHQSTDPAIHQSIPSSPESSPIQNPEHCLYCGDPLPGLLPDATRPSPWCSACGSPIAAPPGLSIRELCSGCGLPVPVHGYNIKRWSGKCAECGTILPNLDVNAPLKWLPPDSEHQKLALPIPSCSPPDDCSKQGEETPAAASPSHLEERKPCAAPSSPASIHQSTDPAIHESTDPSIPAPLQNSNTPLPAAAPATPSEPCPKCHREQLPLTPEGKRPTHACWFCYAPLYDPGTEFCPGCHEALPALAPNGQRPYSDCRICGFRLLPPSSSAPAPDSIAA